MFFGGLDDEITDEISEKVNTIYQMISGSKVLIPTSTQFLVQTIIGKTIKKTLYFMNSMCG